MTEVKTVTTYEEVTDEKLDKLRAEITRLRNSLAWVRHIALQHYIGQAFDPEHMRGIANMAADALEGKEYPDITETWDRAMKKARKLAKWFEEMDPPEPPRT